MPSSAFSMVQPRILIIGRDSDSIFSLSQILANLDVVHVLGDEAHLLEKLREQHPDLILLDFRLRAPNSLDLCAAIKRDHHLSDIPIIFIVEKGVDGDSEAKMIDAGAADFITSPFNSSLVQSRVRAHLSNGALLKANSRAMPTVQDATGHNHMLVSLEEKEELLRHFIENAPVAIAMFDCEMRHLAASKRFLEIYQVTEEIIGRNHYDVFPDLPERWREAHRSGLRGEVIRCEEDSYIHSSGKQEWNRWELKPWYRNGEIGGIVLFVEIITERKEAENRERRLSEMYRALSATNKAIMHAASETELFSAVCRIAIEFGGMRLASIGVPDAQGGFVAIASQCEPENGHLHGLAISSADNVPEGLGPVSMAYSEKRAVVINDISNSGLAAPWKLQLQEQALHSLSTFPIIKNSKAFAVLVIASDRIGSFDDEIVRLLQEMATNISFALDGFEREKARRYAEAALRESEGRFRKLFEDINIAVQGYDRERRVIYWNPASEKLYGYSSSEALGKKLEELIIPPAMCKQVVSAVEEWITLGRAIPAAELMLMHKDGGPVPVFSSHVMQMNAFGEPEMYCIDIDMADLKKAEETMQLAAMVYRESSEGMVILDAEGKVLSVNPAFERITGYSAGDVVGKAPTMFRTELHSEEHYREMRESLGATGCWHGEMWSKRKNGEIFAATLSINTCFTEDGARRRRVVLFSDVTTKKRSEEMLWHQANFDVLTGLPNRNLFLDHLSQEIRKARRASQRFALMFIDLDGFKDVNDTLGHDMGDLLLKEAAERLQGCVRESDIVARLGGDEFTVILPELHEAGSVERVARTILQSLAEPVRLGEERVYVSASIGITLFPGDAGELEGLLKNADQAMYAAKQAGRNRYHYFTPFMQETAQLRMRMVSDLRGALEGNQFEVVYQPIIDLASGVIHKAEALIRWRHPTRGLINPLEFIPLAEDTGMIFAFGNWVFHEAARQAAKWRRQYHSDFQISVNISPMQFRNEGIDSSIWFEHLKNLGLPAHGVVVEITESLLLDATPKVIDQLMALQQAGIEVALDDFGVGYSSLSYLQKFDIDYLKIDQAFVRNVTAGSDDLALCEAIIVMAHKLGIKVIAEGVETAKQKSLLAEAGCDYAQGYFFTGPLPAEQLDALLEETPGAFQCMLS